MRRIAICLSIIFWLAAPPAHSDDAMDYYNLGLESSVTRKKIEYFTKALELNAGLVDAYEKRGLLYYFQGNYQGRENQVLLSRNGKTSAG